MLFFVAARMIFMRVRGSKKNICGGLFLMFSSHENDLEDLVAQSISWRSLIGNTLTK